MKPCPDCGEDLDEVAIICRVCDLDRRHRDRTALVLVLVVMTGIGLIGLSMYGGTAYAVDIDDAHRAVALMERDRILLNRQCGPNQATIPVKSWDALPSDATRANLLRTLARLCLEVNRGDQMELLGEAGERLAVFDGARMFER
jgi:hypothetical protein